MELIIFNRLNSSNAKSRKPNLALIRVHSGLGVVYFNATALDVMGVKEGDHIQFVFDPSRPVTWYISKAGAEDGIKIRRSSKSGKITSKRIAESIIETYSPDMNNVSFQLSPILTQLEGAGIEAFCILNKVIPNAR